MQTRQNEFIKLTTSRGERCGKYTMDEAKDAKCITDFRGTAQYLKFPNRVIY